MYIIFKNDHDIKHLIVTSPLVLASSQLITKRLQTKSIRSKAPTKKKKKPRYAFPLRL